MSLSVEQEAKQLLPCQSTSRVGAEGRGGEGRGGEGRGGEGRGGEGRGGEGRGGRRGEGRGAKLHVSVQGDYKTNISQQCHQESL